MIGQGASKPAFTGRRAVRAAPAGGGTRAKTRQGGAPRAAAAPAAQGAEAMAAQWLALDADPASRAKVEALLAAGDQAALRDLFCQRLEFGAGARAAR